MGLHRSGKFEGKIYRDLCLSLSDRADQVEWGNFNSDDWYNLYQTAREERVAPLLYWTLKNARTDLNLPVPDEFLAGLRTQYFDTWARNTSYYQELKSILEKLEYAGIEVVVLKGAALAANVYPDLGLRPMRDLDILVRETQISDATNLARSMEYIEHFPSTRPEVEELISYHVSLKRNGGQKSFLEIHTSLIGGGAIIYSVSMDWFWDQIEPFSWEYRESEVKIRG